jgi:hypothetical protein
MVKEKQEINSLVVYFKVVSVLDYTITASSSSMIIE